MTTTGSGSEFKQLPGLQAEMHNTDGYLDSYGTIVQPMSLLQPDHPRTELTLRKSERVIFNGTNFPISTGRHFLAATTLHIILPELRLRKEVEGKVRIAWAHCPLLSAVEHLRFAIKDQADFKLDRVPSIKDQADFKLDRASLHIHRQVYEPDPVSFDRGIGNRANLTNWASYLPAASLWMTVPWPFMFPHGSSFPLMFLDSKQPAELTAAFELSVSKLLRMQVQKDGEWINIPANTKALVGASKLEAPVMTMYYDQLNPHDLRMWQADAPSTCAGVPNRFEYYFYDYWASEPKAARRGGKVEVSLEAKTSVHAVHVLAQNAQAARFNYVANYSTASEDHTTGDCPITKLTLDDAFTDYSAEYFTDIEYRLHGLTAPTEPGYLAWFPGKLHPLTRYLDAGVSPSAGSKLTVYLTEDASEPETEAEGKHDPLDFLSLMKSPESERAPAEYQVLVRLLVRRKFTFVRDDKLQRWVLYVDTPRAAERSHAI